jgi:hypothetical protein
MSTPEQQHPEIMPTLEVVVQAYQDVLEHNRRHTGIGATMAGIVKRAVHGGEVFDTRTGEIIERPAEDTPSLHDTDEAVFEGDASAEIKDFLHRDTFTRIGLTVGPFGPHGKNIEGERTTSEKLVPLISNTELFKEFLGGLQKEELDKEKEKILLDTITFSSDVVRRSVKADADDQVKAFGEDVLRTFVMLQPEYDRLGLDAESVRQRHEKSAELNEILLGESVPLSSLSEKLRKEHDEFAAHHYEAERAIGAYKSLDKYATYWGRDLLGEYVVAEKGQYLEKPSDQRYGPAIWCCDTSDEHLMRNWEVALNFARDMQSSDRTRQFADEVLAGLNESVNTQLDWLSHEHEGYGTEYTAPKVRIMQDVRMQLDELMHKDAA